MGERTFVLLLAIAMVLLGAAMLAGVWFLLTHAKFSFS